MAEIVPKTGHFNNIFWQKVHIFCKIWQEASTKLCINEQLYGLSLAKHWHLLPPTADWQLNVIIIFISNFGCQCATNCLVILSLSLSCIETGENNGWCNSSLETEYLMKYRKWTYFKKNFYLQETFSVISPHQSDY